MSHVERARLLASALPGGGGTPLPPAAALLARLQAWPAAGATPCPVAAAGGWPGSTPRSVVHRFARQRTTSLPCGTPWQVAAEAPCLAGRLLRVSSGGGGMPSPTGLLQPDGTPYQVAESERLARRLVGDWVLGVVRCCRFQALFDRPSPSTWLASFRSEY